MQWLRKPGPPRRPGSPGALPWRCFCASCKACRFVTTPRGCQPGDRFLGNSEFPGESALPVTATELRRGRLSRMNAKSDNAPCDVHRSHRRIGQAPVQSLPGGQPGSRLCAHLSPLCACRSVPHQPAIIAASAGQLRACWVVFGAPASPKRTGCGPGAGVPAGNGRL
jgi:hypothetical protein